MTDPINFREGSGRHIDFTCQEQTGVDGNGDPIFSNFSIGSLRVVVVLKDNINNAADVTYDSATEQQRLAIEPDDGGGPQTGVVRIWPSHEIFRSEKGPYKAFIWVYKTPSDKIDFPGDIDGFEINILPAWGTEDF